MTTKMAQTPQPDHLDPLNRGPTLRRTTSVSSLRPEVLDHDINCLTAEDHITAIEHLEMLYYDVVGVLQAKLYSRSEELQIIQSKHEKECALAETKEKSRKESARARAQQRDTIIISLKEELEYKNQYIRSLKEYAATAAKFIENTQVDIQHSMFRLDMMRHEKDQLADRVSRLSRANTKLHKKKAAAKKEMEKSKQEMNVEKRDLMDAVDRKIRRAGAALIQRDTEQARCRQRRSPLNASMNLKMRASVLEEHNHTLIAMMEAMQLQKGQDEEEKKQLRRLNLQNIAMIQKYRLAIDRLNATNGWNLDELTEAQPNE